MKSSYASCNTAIPTMLLNPISWKQNIAFHVLHFTHSVYILICILLLFQPKANAAFENVGVSARPMGMGGAYVALVNDTSAMIWNPAGLARLNEPEIGLNYLELYGLVNYSFVGWAYPLQLGRTVGVSVSSSSDPDGLYQELAFDISAAQEIAKNLHLGLNIKYLSSAASIGEISVGTSNGGVVDLGVRYALADGRLAFGLALPNLLSHVRYRRAALKNADAKDYNERLARESRIGLALRLDLFSPRLSNAIFALEFANGDPIFGGEYVIGNSERRAASVRLGWRLTEGVSRGITAGLGYRFGNLQLDYAFVGGRYQSQTSLFSVTLYY